MIFFWINTHFQFFFPDRRLQLLFNIEAVFAFLLVATIKCVSPFGFHHIGIVSPKQTNSKFYNSVIEPFKTETDEIPIWKKFHFWKKKRNFWSDQGFNPNARLQPELRTDIFNSKSDDVFSEPESLGSLSSIDSEGISSDGFDPELELNDMFTEPDPSGPGYWTSDVLSVGDPGQNDGFGILQDVQGDTEDPPQTEGFINPGVRLSYNMSAELFIV